MTSRPRKRVRAQISCPGLTGYDVSYVDATDLHTVDKHARLPGRYGVIVMNAGFFPALIALSAVLVAIRIGVTVPES